MSKSEEYVDMDPATSNVNNEPKNALACARRNWFVFPLPAFAKGPPPWEGYARLASRNPTRIKAWHRARRYRCNWGIAPGPSGLLIIDVDDKPGKDGSASLGELEHTYGPLPRTFTVATPSGGRHLYFRGTHIFRNKFRPGLDSAPYVVAPGCTLSGGGKYRVLHNLPVVPAPNWLPGVIGGPNEVADAEQIPAIELDTDANVQRAIHYLAHDAPSSIQGHNGEQTMLMVYGALKDMGISMETAIDLVEQHYNVPPDPNDPLRPCCDPLWQLGDGELADRHDIKAHNAWNYLRKVAPGADSPEADFADPPPTADELARVAAFWNEDGIPLHRALRRKARALAKKYQGVWS